MFSAVTRQYFTPLTTLFTLSLLLFSACQQTRTENSKIGSAKNATLNTHIDDQDKEEGSVYSDSMIQLLTQTKKSIDANTINSDTLFHSIISNSRVYASSNFDIKNYIGSETHRSLTKEEKLFVIGSKLLGKIKGNIDTSIVILNQSGESHFGPSIELVRYNPSMKEFYKIILSVEYLSENSEWYLNSKMVDAFKIETTKVITSKEFDEQGVFTGQILKDTLIETISL